MIRNVLFITLGLFVALSSLSLAQETTRVLLLPVDVRGSRESLTSAEMTGFLEKVVQRDAPGVDVVFPTRFTQVLDTPPSVADARALLQQYRVDSVVWLTVGFQSRSIPTESRFTRNLTLTAAARLWIFSGVSDRVILDQPVSVVRQTPLSSSVGVSAEALALRELKFACGSELASSLVHAALDAQNKRLVSAWKEPEALEAEASEAYQLFLRIFSAYQTAVRESDFISAAAAQSDARLAWVGLSEADKANAEAQYPGIQKWLEPPQP